MYETSPPRQTVEPTATSGLFTATLRPDRDGGTTVSCLRSSPQVGPGDVDTYGDSRTLLLAPLPVGSTF